MNQETNYEEETSFLTDTELNQIVEQYRKQQLTENLTGPGISIISHLVILLLCFVFIATANPDLRPPIIVEKVEIEEIVLDKEIVDEIIEIEDEITDEETAPVDNPAPPSDVVSEESSPEDVSDEAPETDDNAETEDVLDIVNNNSPMTFPSSMGGRKPAGRAKGVKDGGGSKRGQASVNRALRWLASVQNPDGSWGDKGNDTDAGHTGLALLVFLAHGETPLSEKYGKTVQSAMRWLSNYGNQSDLNVKRRPMGYAHGIATYAISEAYAMTKIPFMQTAMENCIDKLIDGQMGNGGFGYAYTSGPRWDLSVAGWNFQALKAARMAGCTNEKLSVAIKKSISFLRGDGYNGQGAFGYAADKGGKGGSKPNMTGVGVVALQLLGAPDVPQVREGCEFIGKKRLEDYEQVMGDPSKWTSIGSHNLYGWYYDTQAMFNTQNVDKARWKRWRKAFETVLIRAQHDEGYWEVTSHGTGANTPGRVLATCWSALQLEVYYRYLPTFDKTKVDKFIEEDSINSIGDDSGIIIEID